MIDNRKLAALLSEFARTLATDFSIQTILDHLVERIVDVLPITSAGVTLISAGSDPQFVAASDADALRFEQLQTATGEGPCVEAFRTGEVVSVPDLRRGDPRFPEFCAQSSAAGLRAVFTFPLRDGGSRRQLGALDLYRDTTGPLDADDLVAAQTLADVTTAYLLNARVRDQLHEAAATLRESALHDSMTGLPNRAFLRHALGRAAARARLSPAGAALLFADLDDFKSVNDTYGHAIGDALLVAVGRRLAPLVRPTDTLARIGGDEFVILCEDVHARSDVDALIRRVDDAFTAPFELAPAGDDTVSVQITASVGIAFASRPDQIGFQLVRDADTAMYQAKRRGGARHQVIDLREAYWTSDHAQLRRDLVGALPGHQLRLVYQPITLTGNGTLVGVEALLRWTHPTRGPIPALTTVMCAEESALIDEIGAWVLDRACREQATWNATRAEAPLVLAVNVSPRQLVQTGFEHVVERVLGEVGTDPSTLVLEVTEGVFIADGKRATRALAALRALGVRVALDDFGTGYSSLSYLRQLPVDIVKIDRGFVAEMTRSGPSSAIVSAVTGLAHALGMQVAAEGVETAAQCQALESIGCELAQGFYYARPLDVPELTAMLARSPTRAPHLPEGGRDLRLGV